MIAMPATRHLFVAKSQGARQSLDMLVVVSMTPQCAPKLAHVFEVGAAGAVGLAHDRGNIGNRDFASVVGIHRSRSIRNNRRHMAPANVTAFKRHAQAVVAGPLSMV